MGLFPLISYKSDVGFLFLVFVFRCMCVVCVVCVNTYAYIILYSVDLNLVDVVQSISIIVIGAQMIPSLVNGNLFKLAPESFSHAL